MSKPRKRWAESDILLLTKLYPDTPAKDIAEKLNCSVSGVYKKASDLGLKKSISFLSSPKSGRLNGKQGGSTRFEKGRTPWNKGTAYRAGGRSVETQFKRGQSSHNHAPIGSYRIDPHGTLQRKISNEKGANNKRWRSVHELIWIEANGPVPTGHIVVFKPGMKSTELEKITLETIECLSRSEHIRRHSLHNYPTHIKAAILARGALNRKINNVSKHQ